MASFRDQVTFSGESSCEIFVANRLRKDMCINCYQKLLAHSSEAVKDDDIQAGLEFTVENKASLVFTNSVGHSLYLGGFKAVLNVPVMEQCNIKSVVNTAGGLEMFGSKFPNAVNAAKERGVDFLDLGWVDSLDQVMKVEDLEKSILFIHEGLKSNSVLVHCAQGKSRSSSVVVAYLMTLNNEGFDKMLTFVKRKRKMAQPNKNFQKQIQNWFQSNSFNRLEKRMK